MDLYYTIANSWFLLFFASAILAIALGLFIYIPLRHKYGRRHHIISWTQKMDFVGTIASEMALVVFGIAVFVFVSGRMFILGNYSVVPAIVMLVSLFFTLWQSVGIYKEFKRLHG